MCVINTNGSDTDSVGCRLRAAVDVTAALYQGAVSSSGRSHRCTQAELDESASDDEADAVSELPFEPAECHLAAVNKL
jgi:hypothetical protein